MKNSIKTLSLILLALLAANTSFAVNYTYNGSFSPSVPGGGLTSSDSVTLTSGTWNLSGTTNVRGVRLQGGTLGLGTRTLNGRVTVFGNSTITASNNGNINGTLAIASGTLTMGDDFEADRTNLKGGTLNLDNNDLTGPVNVLASSSISATSTNASIENLTARTGTLTIAGSGFGLNDLTMAGGNLNLASFLLTLNGDIFITGNGSISSTGTGRIYTSGVLEVNGGTLTINNAEVITDDLDFNSANDILTTNNGLISFDNGNNNVTGAASDRHVNGTIRIYMDNAVKSVATYPVGNGTFYAPIQLSTNGKDSAGVNLSNISNFGTHFINITYIGSKHPVVNFDNTVAAASGSEYWLITRSTTKPAASFGFFLNTTGSAYGQSAVGSTTNLTADLELARLNGATNSWTILPASVGTAISGGVPVITTAPMSPNTAFTFASTNLRTNFLTPLPVSIIDFSAKANDVNIEVKWSTASEKDNAAFVVEKSIDGQVWSAIGTIRGAKTSNVVNNYGMVDFKAVAGVQYYRLKQIDEDGTVNYSKAIAVNFSKASTLNVNLFPNPAKDALNITTENNASGEVNIQILNSMGQTVYNQVVQAGLVQTIDIASFIPGVYYVTVIAEGETKIIRLLKN